MNEEKNIPGESNFKSPLGDLGVGGILINERSTRTERLLQVAREMMTAARTAPKGKGFDIIEVATITGKAIEEVSEAMLVYSEKSGLKFVTRDAENILQAEAIVLVGTRQQVHNLNCGYCGFPTCAAKSELPEVPCSINSVDVGIAIGSACAVAADRRVDSRVMFSVGRVVQELGWMPGCSNIYGIPISCLSKNPFFDRIPKTPVVK
ncbi:MAG TPA: DUF2148 domain-containing protein [Paludibacter sp.]|nr:DUF2148 domain-containing protein [Paludibacter sp.]